MYPDKDSIVDILTTAQLVVEYIGEVSLDDFLNDIQSQSLAVHRLMIIGEATKRLSNYYSIAGTRPRVPVCLEDEGVLQR